MLTPPSLAPRPPAPQTHEAEKLMPTLPEYVCAEILGVEIRDGRLAVHFPEVTILIASPYVAHKLMTALVEFVDLHREA